MAISLSRNFWSSLVRASGRLSGYEGATVLQFPTRRNLSSGAYDFETLAVKMPHKHVINVEINRPEQLNSMNKDFWREFLACFREIQCDTDCRAVVISGAGRLFTAGLDFSDMKEITSQVTSDDDVARKSKFLQASVAMFQEAFNAVEKCSKPVITAVHSGCVGAGVDLMCAADIRYCSEDAWFSIKEVDVGMAADLGTLQRMPRIIGNDSLLRELVYTARRMPSAEAKELGLVSRIFPTKEATLEGAIELAKLIASKSPVAVQGSKVNMVYSRDHSVPDGLKFITYWNSMMLQSEDILKASLAVITKSTEPPTFTKL